MRSVVRLEYPYMEIPLILKSSYKEDTYYGVDRFESKKLKIILNKYGCRKSFHSLPGSVTVTVFPFVWDRIKQCFRIELAKKMNVQLNTLEGAIMHYPIIEGGS